MGTFLRGRWCFPPLNLGWSLVRGPRGAGDFAWSWEGHGCLQGACRCVCVCHTPFLGHISEQSLLSLCTSAAWSWHPLL